MTHHSTFPLSSPMQNTNSGPLTDISTLELAQALAQRLAIADDQWHRLKSNRQARAQEHIIAALVFLLKDVPSEALPHLQQATGWLDGTLIAPPCPTHGSK